MVAAVRGAGGAVPRSVSRLRRNPPPDQVVLLALAVFGGLATLGGAALSPSIFPPVMLALPLLFGGLLLTRAPLLQLTVVISGLIAFDITYLGIMSTRPGSLVVVVVTALVAFEFARSREETGLGGLRGDSVLVELRRRLEMQGDIPYLPAPWHAQPVVKPAGGAPFAGDFVVSALTGPNRLEVALVDVSGKGVEAGTR